MELKHEPDAPVTEIRHLLAAQAFHGNPVEPDASAVRLVQRPHNLQQRGLSGTARPHDAHHLALTDIEVDSFEHFK